MSVEKMGRRRFIQQAGVYGLVGVATVGGLTAISGCGGDKKAETPAADSGHGAIKAAHEAANPCTDLSGLSADELATRTTFKYQQASEDPTKVCDACNFWHLAPDAELCGTCTLVKGPIHPLATCMSWVAKPKT